MKNHLFQELNKLKRFHTSQQNLLKRHIIVTMLKKFIINLQKCLKSKKNNLKKSKDNIRLVNKSQFNNNIRILMNLIKNNIRQVNNKSIKNLLDILQTKLVNINNKNIKNLLIQQNNIKLVFNRFLCLSMMNLTYHFKMNFQSKFRWNRFSCKTRMLTLNLYKINLINFPNAICQLHNNNLLNNSNLKLSNTIIVHLIMIPYHFL